MITVATESAFTLIHEGAKALSKVEHVGIRIDERRLQENIQEAAREIMERESKMKADPLWKRWKKRFGEGTKLGSREQLGTLLFEDMGYACPNRTATGRFKVDEAALQAVDLEFVEDYIQWQKFTKAKGTFLEGIKNETIEGYLHAIYNLNIATTFRSSSDSPNFQNLPIRDKILGELIRSVVIPRKGYILMEIDFKGIEVRGSACYNRDPVLIEYILDETKDMHRDMAAQCYLCVPDDVSKSMRYCGKNQFVFPEFYGDWYKACAKQLWESILKMHLETNSGVPVGEHLAKKGIRELGKCDSREQPVRGTFEHHIQKVEKDFWGRRFRVYSEWKDEWYAAYEKRGWFQMYTGFVCSGVMSRNDVINYPVQGAAFHLLLWSLIKLQKWLIRNKMRSMIIGQIHDSLLLDVHESEVEVVYAKAKEIMTELIKEYAPWLIVPLEIETEVAEENWHKKHSYQAAA